MGAQKRFDNEKSRIDNKALMREKIHAETQDENKNFTIRFR